MQLTSKPRQLQDPSWDIILKSLHKIDNPQRDKSLQGHIGINGRMILQLVQYEHMRTAVLNTAKQALRSRKAAVIFECSQGRHRSVGATGILYQLLRPLVSKITVIHASRNNWSSTCGGSCPECIRGPPPQFHNEVDSLRRELLAQIDRDYIEPCTFAFSNCPQFLLYKSIVGQVDGFRCQADQQLLDSFVHPLPSQPLVPSFRIGSLLSVDCRDYISGGIILRTAEDCTKSTFIFDSRNCSLQKSKHSKNPSQKLRNTVCGQTDSLPKFSVQQTQLFLLQHATVPALLGINTLNNPGTVMMMNLEMTYLGGCYSPTFCVLLQFLPPRIGELLSSY